jgi:hypothetical protein
LVEVSLDGAAVPALSATHAFAALGRFQLGDTAANRAFDIRFDDVDLSPIK